MQKNKFVEESLCLPPKKFWNCWTKTEPKIAIKNIYKQPRKRPTQGILEYEEDEVLKDENNSSDSNCMIFRPRKQQFKSEVVEKVARQAGSYVINFVLFHYLQDSLIDHLDYLMLYITYFQLYWLKALTEDTLIFPPNFHRLI